LGTFKNGINSGFKGKVDNESITGLKFKKQKEHG